MPMTIDLSSKSALVTGAASGIGRAIAQDLSDHGACVLVADLNEEQGRAFAASLPRAVFQRADVTSREECRALVDRAEQEWGGVDILVNNAGVQHVAPVEEFPEDRWEQLIRILLIAPFLLTRYAVPHMYARGWGRIINIASIHGLVASPYKSAYVSAKHGLLGLTKTVALEAATHSPNVTVNAICPSYVRTPLVEKQIADQAKHHGISESEVMERILLDRNAIKRLIEPDDVAMVVAFLCRDDMWSITGRALPMDAGWLAH